MLHVTFLFLLCSPSVHQLFQGGVDQIRHGYRRSRVVRFHVGSRREDAEWLLGGRMYVLVLLSVREFVLNLAALREFVFNRSCARTRCWLSLGTAINCLSSFHVDKFEHSMSINWCVNTRFVISSEYQTKTSTSRLYDFPSLWLGSMHSQHLVICSVRCLSYIIMVTYCRYLPWALPRVRRNALARWC